MHRSQNTYEADLSSACTQKPWMCAIPHRHCCLCATAKHAVCTQCECVCVCSAQHIQWHGTIRNFRFFYFFSILCSPFSPLRRSDFSLCIFDAGPFDTCAFECMFTFVFVECSSILQLYLHLSKQQHESKRNEIKTKAKMKKWIKQINIRRNGYIDRRNETKWNEMNTARSEGKTPKLKQVNKQMTWERFLFIALYLPACVHVIRCTSRCNEIKSA